MQITLTCQGSMYDLPMIINPLCNLRKAHGFIGEIRADFGGNTIVYPADGGMDIVSNETGRTCVGGKDTDNIREENDAMEIDGEMTPTEFKITLMCQFPMDDLPNVLDPLFILRKHLPKEIGSIGEIRAGPMVFPGVGDPMKIVATEIDEEDVERNSDGISGMMTAEA